MSSPRGIVSIPLLVAGLFLLTGLGYGGYKLFDTNRLLGMMRSELASTTSLLASTTAALTNSNTDRVALSEALAREQQRSGQLASQVSDISSTVDTLTKLTQTDKELLQKYSRVYFLNENYVPKDLSDIDSQFLYNTDKKTQFHSKARPFLEHMLSDAASSSVPMLVISGYRSFGTQAALKVSYKVNYGAGSNRFSADQGYSEHQLGTAVDLTTKASGENFNGFSKTPAFDWLVANGYRYGFILSYPPGNSYYQYEPWHWRFVGVALATYMHNQNLHFYDLPQREIDPYLVNIFD